MQKSAKGFVGATHYLSCLSSFILGAWLVWSNCYLTKIIREKWKNQVSSASFFTMKHAIFLSLAIFKVDLADTETILGKLCYLLNMIKIKYLKQYQNRCLVSI